MCDPYDNGTPKYSTAHDIYYALCELIQTEEMNILTEIGADVSWDNQTYYYTEKGNKLKDKFEEISDYGNKIWLLDLAIKQTDRCEIHGIIYDALCNEDLAKRIGFKKLFLEHMLRGYDKYYAKITEAYLDELGELNRFDSYTMMITFNKVLEANGIPSYGASYQDFAYSLSNKIENLRLTEETKLIAECRAHLTAYDDFIFGLRVNQALHEQQEHMYECRVAELQAAYNEKIKVLFSVADRAGLLSALNAELKQIEKSAAKDELIAEPRRRANDL